MLSCAGTHTINTTSLSQVPRSRMTAVVRYHFPAILLCALFVIAGCQGIASNSAISMPTVTADILVTTQQGINFEISGDQAVEVPPGKTRYQPAGNLYELSVIESKDGSSAEFRLYFNPDLSANTYEDQIKECPTVLSTFTGQFCYTIFVADFDPGPPVASRLHLQSTGAVVVGTLEMTLEDLPRSLDVSLVMDQVRLQS